MNLLERVRTAQALWDANELLMLEIYDSLIKQQSKDTQ